MEISDVMAPAQGTETPPSPAPHRKEWPTGVEPDDPPRAPREPPANTAPRGRPWVKGQSGNPAGRPPKRAHAAHYVARLVHAVHGRDDPDVAGMGPAGHAPVARPGHQQLRRRRPGMGGHHVGLFRETLEFAEVGLNHGRTSLRSDMETPK